ncbi:colicin [Niallia sp. FSL R7-0271]|uniref:colicin n=1 Tax=Niallia sp. FSL R7-0271 TaxID=2921678 RepID=UPI0030F77598
MCCSGNEIEDNLDQHHDTNKPVVFGNEFWKSVANSSFASEFNPRNVARMAAGNAPIAPKVEHYGMHKSYILHHKQPIDKGGEVYNLDNLMITSPRMHQVILDPAYHFGKKGN